MPDGSYRVGVSQIATMFSIRPDHAARDFKRLLGKGFQFAHVASDLHPKAVNTLSLEEFTDLAWKLAVKGNAEAEAWVKANTLQNLKQSFDSTAAGC